MSIKKTSLILIFLLVFSNKALSEPLSLNEIGQAACRVSMGENIVGAKNPSGSGTCVHEDEDFFYILTNAHVTGTKNSGFVEFFDSGLKTNKLPANVIWRKHAKGTELDFAILQVKRGLFGDFPPRVIPLAPPTHVVQDGDYISAGGCPRGRWLQLWEGHATHNQNESFQLNGVFFTPSPEGGQSGSGVMVSIPDEQGEYHTYVAAILTWRIGEYINKWDSRGNLVGSYGGAIPISTFFSALSNNTSYKPVRVPRNYKNIVNEVKYALGSDGICYPIIRLSNGGTEISVPLGVSIRSRDSGL